MWGMTFEKSLRMFWPRPVAVLDKSLVTQVADYLETQIDALQECHTTPGKDDCDPEVAEECAEVRAWIAQLRAAVNGEAD